MRKIELTDRVLASVDYAFQNGGTSLREQAGRFHCCHHRLSVELKKWRERKKIAMPISDRTMMRKLAYKHTSPNWNPRHAKKKKNP